MSNTITLTASMRSNLASLKTIQSQMDHSITNGYDPRAFINW